MPPVEIYTTPFCGFCRMAKRLLEGKGIPFAENEPTWHHKSRLPAEQIAEMYAALEDA